MKLTITSYPEGLLLVDIEGSELVLNLKVVLEAETKFPVAHQRLYFNGKELHDKQTLLSAGITDGEMLQLQIAVPAVQAKRTPDVSLNPDGTARNPESFFEALSSESALSMISKKHPGLGNAIATRDPNALQRILRVIHEENQWRERLEKDPFDVEAQAKIEQYIQQSNIAENQAIALEYNPAQFTSVYMLYVMTEVNNHVLKTFVDSGAQVSIMSKLCAEKCGIMRLCDTRYSGVAVGVGSDKVVGRIHSVQLKIGTQFYMCGITVLENPKLDFIFGLDLLRRHQCCIDLKDNVLRLGTDNLAVPFLPEHEVPRSIAMEDITDVPSGANERASTSATFSSQPGPSGVSVEHRAGPSQSGSDMEAKIGRLVELGFEREAARQALIMANGNEDIAAGYLFG